MGHWERNFFLRAVEKMELLETDLFWGQSMKDGLSEECFHEVGVSF